MNDLLLIPVIFLAVGGILVLLWRLFLIDSGLFLIGFVSFLILWRAMDSIFSLQRLNFTRKIWHRMDYLVLRLSLSSLTLLCLSWQAGQGISGR